MGNLCNSPSDDPPTSSGGYSSGQRSKLYTGSASSYQSMQSPTKSMDSVGGSNGRSGIKQGTPAAQRNRPSAAMAHERPTDGLVSGSSSSTGPFEDVLNFCPEKYWVKDEEGPTCGYCGEEFSLTNRRHHCRLCGDIFHGGDCSRKAGRFDSWVCFYCYSYHSGIKETLQTGVVLTKYTRDLERSHQRHFWLSSDGRELIWKELETRSRLSGLTEPAVHSLRLVDVTRVQLSGPPGLQSYNHLHAFQIITGERPYVLEASSISDHATWTEGLKCAVYVCQSQGRLQGRRLEDRARKHAKRSRDSHRQLTVDRLQARQKQRS